MKHTPDTSRRHALKLFAGMPLLPLAGTLSASTAVLAACGGGDDVVMSSVSFSAMAAPTLANAAAMATTTVGSTMTVNFSDASKLDFKLAYQPFFVTGDMVADGKGGKTLAGLITTSTTTPSWTPAWQVRRARSTRMRLTARRC